jgi:hypothetical protein
MKFDERNPKQILIPPFLFPWQLRQGITITFISRRDKSLGGGNAENYLPATSYGGKHVE